MLVTFPKDPTYLKDMLFKGSAPLWWWMDERQRIFKARQKGGPAPWSKDKIMQTYRFCNVYREQDTVTKWIARNWRSKIMNHKSRIFAMYVARMINRTETLARLPVPSPYSEWLEAAKKLFATMKADGEQIFGGSYMLVAGVDKSLSHFKKTTNSLKVDPFWNRVHNIENTTKHLQSFAGCGRFVAYEIATDLRHTPSVDISDRMTWANPGPGSTRGINRILGLPFSGQHARLPEYVNAMAVLTKIANQLPCLKWMPRFEARDIEHSLCEMDKYLRALNDEGRPKQLFKALPLTDF